MNSFPWGWIFWGVVVMVAVRLLLVRVYFLRDHLRGLLVTHVKSELEEAQKRQNILRMQAKIRERNEKAKAEKNRLAENAETVEFRPKRAA